MLVAFCAIATPYRPHVAINNNRYEAIFKGRLGGVSTLSKQPLSMQVGRLNKQPGGLTRTRRREMQGSAEDESLVRKITEGLKSFFTLCLYSMYALRYSPSPSVPCSPTAWPQAGPNGQRKGKLPHLGRDKRPGDDKAPGLTRKLVLNCCNRNCKVGGNTTCSTI